MIVRCVRAEANEGLWGKEGKRQWPPTCGNRKTKRPFSKKDIDSSRSAVGGDTAQKTLEEGGRKNGKTTRKTKRSAKVVRPTVWNTKKVGGKQKMKSDPKEW